MKQKNITTILLLLTSILIAGEDHSEYIEGPFDSVHEITETCLECHEDAAHAFMQDVHWTWESKPMEVPGKSEPVVLGKRSTINNFCITLKGNEARCTSCHAGYGWKDDSFDFSDPINIDCLVCHDQTGTYKKFPTGAGYPVTERKEFPPNSGNYYKPPDLEAIAQSVGDIPTRQACGSCHFYGGGANNVKHGDLGKELINPSRELDVHMGGLDFTCAECHETIGHQIPGDLMSVSTERGDLSCEGCHTNQPHPKSSRLNYHFKSVACQTCHIPEFARENPTKLYWDWSTAGQDIEVKTDKFGMPMYNKKKGNAIWDKNVIPTYAWYNGKSQHMIIGDTIDLDSINKITSPVGDKSDLKAKIYPFFIHGGKQIADKINKYLLPTHLFDGYWKHFNWGKAVKNGSKEYDLDYSGKYTFVETEMWWKINHMVAPKENSIKCTACHSKTRTTRMNWEALGYPDGDPRYNKGTARIEYIRQEDN
jgi:octaheme c-type cytochrome (tetrathionate reductase family)